MRRPTVKRQSHTSGVTRAAPVSKEKLRERVLEESFEAAAAKRIASSQCLPREVLAYLVNAGDEKALRDIKSHADNCNECAEAIRTFEKAAGQRDTLDLDIPGSQGNVYRDDENILNMVLRAKDEKLQLIDHTGELVSEIPGFERQVNEKTTEIIVRKDIPSHNLSIHVAMSGVSGAASYEARFCAMKPDIQECIKHLDVSLIKQGKDVAKKLTNEKGCAEFKDMKKGNYEIRAGNSLIASITIK